jgi:diguanylate cyclase
MAVPSGEHESTLALAQIALEQIRALHQPALPRNFEIWYQYATGHYPDLNKSINDTLTQKRALSDADMEEIYSTHVLRDFCC